MAITVEEIFDGRSSSLNRLWERRYSRAFDVETSDRYIGAKAVRSASGIPTIGAFYTNGLDEEDPLYEEDLGAFVNEITAEQIGGAEGAGIAWKVAVTYEPWDPFDSDPTLQKIRVTFGGERTERVVDFDRNGVPIRNSAGDRFGDPVTVDDHITTLVITRNELVSDFNISLASAYSDTINGGAWNGIAARWCKMGIISTSEEQYDSFAQRWYYKVTYPVQIGRKPWRKDLLDQGFNELRGGPYYGGGDETKPTPIMNEGQPISDPVALDGFGQRLPVGGEPVTLTFDVFEETNWDGLNINLALRLGL